MSIINYAGIILSIIGAKITNELITDVEQTMNNTNAAPRNVLYWSTDIPI